MKTITKKFSTKAIFLLLLIILFGVILRSFHLFSPLTELHDFRQIQTASIVWLYDKFGYNLFNYHVPMFGGKYWIHELPIYQTIIFFLTKVLGQHDYVGRLVSIGSYIIAGLSLFYISNKVLDKKRYSLLTILLYSILPLNIFFFRSYMIDPFTLSLALTTLALTIYSFTSLNIRKITLLFSFIFVGTLSKLTIFFPFILPIGYLFYSSFSRIPQKKERKKLLFLIAVYTIIIVFAFLYWFNYGNSLNRLSYTLQPKDVKTWYLGIRYFQPEYYYLILKRLIYELSVPGVIIILIGIISLLRDKSRAYAKVLLLWIFNTVLYLVVFNNLNYIHNYYQLPIYPPLVITFVYGLVYSYSILRKKTIIFLITVYILLSTSFPKSYFFVKDNPYQDYISTITKVIQQCTNEEKKIIYVWPNADPDHPTVLYYARRLGYNFDLFKLEKIKEIIQYDQEVRSIVFFPVKKGTKEQISSILKKINLMIKEECYRNNTLVLELI